MQSFIFGGGTADTPESVKRKRDVAMAMLGQSRAPRTIGEGISALGDGIVANVMNRRANSAEQAGIASAGRDIGSLGSGSFNSAPAQSSFAPQQNGSFQGSFTPYTPPTNLGEGIAQFGQAVAQRGQQNSQYPSAPGSNPLMNLGRLFMGGVSKTGGLY